MAEDLKTRDKAKPIRRVWIPKPGKKEQRPLGIPVIRDRAVQALVKAALEPEWEAKFEPNSYGFRPGRGAHDAIEAIFKAIKQKTKYVLDADIAKCFDKISHKKLLEKLNTFPILRRQIRAWLKADICDFVKHERNPNHEGTPQGGVISPLLANIALHGMEKRIKEYAATWKGGKRDNQISLSLIRYADDFVIIHENLSVIKQCQKIISDWLAEYDLEIKPEKTRITHTLKGLNGDKPGFNFLGFNIRQYPVGKYQSGKNGHGKTLGFKTLIKPSDESIKRHYAQIAEVIRKHNSAPQEALISKLNPIIKGWSNYYKTINKLKEQGKIRAIGVSNFSAVQLKEASQYGRIDSLQPPYSLFWRQVESDAMPYCIDNNISILAYSSLAQGILTGKFGDRPQFAEGDHRAKHKLFQPENFQRVQKALSQLKPIAEQHNCTLAQLALAWLIAQPQTNAIAGARNAQQVADNAQAAKVTLSQEEITKIDQIGKQVTDHLDNNPVMWDW